VYDSKAAIEAFVKPVFDQHAAEAPDVRPAAADHDRAHGPRIGTVWCTLFDDTWSRALQYLPLVHIWRGPSFFVSGAIRHSVGSIELVRFDEELHLDDLDGSRAQIAESVDLFYGASHGQFRQNQFSMALRDKDWYPAVSGFSSAGPKIAVFEACFLVHCPQTFCRRRNCNWNGRRCDAIDIGWSSSGIGSAVRFVLGFASQASADRKSTRRGWAFAENLFKKSMTISGAWLSAVQSTSPANDIGIAIALGDDYTDAKTLLESADITHALPPRTASPIHLAWKTL
jgi:hypothetical protein